MAITRICTPMHIKQESGEPHDHRLRRRPDEVGQPVGGPVEDPDDRGVGDRGDARAEKEGDEADAVRGPLGADGDRDRDRARPGRERQRQRKERKLHRIAVASLRALPLVALPVGVSVSRGQRAASR